MKEKGPRILINSSSPHERRSFLKKLAGVVAGTAALGGFTNLFAKKTYSGTELSSYATEQPYVGSISMVGFNWAPIGWLKCDGAFVSISLYQTLFSLIGTNFGGNGRDNFKLPDLRGRAPIGFGAGPGLTPWNIGAIPGYENVTLSASNLPAHIHGATVTDPVFEATGNVSPGAFSGRGGTPSNDPINNFPAPAPSGTNIYNTETSGIMGKSPVTIEFNKTAPGSVEVKPNQGGGNSFSVMQPSTAVNFIIAIDGIYPPRN